MTCIQPIQCHREGRRQLDVFHESLSKERAARVGAVTADHLFTPFKEVAMANEAAVMATLTSKLVRREEVAEGTMAFHFDKRSGPPPW